MSTYDPCLLLSIVKEAFALLEMQTDNILFVANDVFIKKEEKMLKKAGLLTKDREKLISTTFLPFNKGVLSI